MRNYIFVTLLFCFLAFTSCNKSASHFTDLSDLAIAESRIAFDYEILLSNCFRHGASLSVDISNPKKYRYLWEIDGVYGGHQNTTIGCLCGTLAKVQVIRLSDGVSVSKSIELPSCQLEAK